MQVIFIVTVSVIIIMPLLQKYDHVTITFLHSKIHQKQTVEPLQATGNINTIITLWDKRQLNPSCISEISVVLTLSLCFILASCTISYSWWGLTNVSILSDYCVYVNGFKQRSRDWSLQENRVEIMLFPTLANISNSWLPS